MPRTVINMVELTDEQCELIGHLLTLADRGLESTGSYAELFGVGKGHGKKWEAAMNEAAQQLAEEFK